jgi:hypothetical protein
MLQAWEDVRELLGRYWSNNALDTCPDLTASAHGIRQVVNRAREENWQQIVDALQEVKPLLRIA